MSACLVPPSAGCQHTVWYVFGWATPFPGPSGSHRALVILTLWQNFFCTISVVWVVSFQCMPIPTEYRLPKRCMVCLWVGHTISWPIWGRQGTGDPPGLTLLQNSIGSIWLDLFLSHGWLVSSACLAPLSTGCTQCLVSSAGLFQPFSFQCRPISTEYRLPTHCMVRF